MAGGGSIPVTPQNVYEYVRKYAEHRMLVVAEQPLHVSTGSQNPMFVIFFIVYLFTLSLMQTYRY